MPGQDVPRNPVPIGGMIAMSANYSGNLAYGSDNSVYLKSGVVTDAKNFPAAPAETVFKVSPVFNSPMLTYNVNSGVAFGNGVFVRSSNTGLIHTSTDGLSWTAGTTLGTVPKFMTFLNGLFWSGGLTNSTTTYLFNSVDGITWNQVSITTAQNVTGLAFGNGVYVACTDGASITYLSIDNGATWTGGPSGLAMAATGIAFGNGLFVLVGSGTTSYSTSPDGSNFTSRSLPYSVSTPNRICFVNGTFMTGPVSTTLLTSPDGISWNVRTLPPYIGYLGFGYGNGQYFGISYNYLVTSTDLVTWTARTPPIGPYASIIPVHWAFGNGTIVVFDGNGGLAAPVISVDGINFSLYGGDATLQAALSGWAYGNGVYLAALAPSGNGGLFRSTDGISWKLVIGITPAVYDRVSFANGLFILSSGTGNPAVMTSADGLTWANRTAPNPSSAAWGKAAYGAGVWVCHAITALTNACISSADGITWNARTIPQSAIWNGIAFGSGKFFITSTNTSTAYSVDGITWTNGPQIPADGIVAGNGLFGVYKNNSVTMRYSSDGGVTWIRANAPAAVNSLEFNAGQFYINTTSGIYQSADLVNWLQISTDTSVNGYKMLPANGSMTLIATPLNGVLASTYGTIKRVANAVAQFASSSSSGFTKGVQLYMRVQ